MSKRMMTLTVLLAMICQADAKGPKSAGKYQKPKGYSRAGVPATSKKSSTYKSSRFPTQPRVTKTPTVQSRPSRTPANQFPTTRPTTTNKYSTRRPTTRPPSRYTPPIRSTKPVQFPTRPTTRPTTTRPTTTRPTTTRPTTTRPATTRPATTSRPKPAQPSFTKRPPVVFYPKPSKLPAAKPPVTSKPPRTPIKNPSRFPTQSPPRYSGLRPSRPSVNQRPSTTTVINRPTVINNHTNITNNKTNVNQWFQKNTWQNRVTFNSQHWNGRPWWHRSDYGDWHHGHWHGHHNSNGRDSWQHVDSNDHRWLNGLSAWGLGNLIYRSGYQAYTNPYYVRSYLIGTTTIDYSRPICVQRSKYEIAYASNEALANKLRQQALANFAGARIAFYLGKMSTAYDNINKAIALMPDDTSMHEFRALVLFSAGQYREAAEVMHAVLAVAPGWDWTTLSGLYRDHDAYTKQLRALETHVRLNRNEPGSRFLLAYHYVTIGAAEKAEEQYRAVLALRPDDRLSSDLLSLVDREQNEFAEEAAPVALKDDILQGDWKATRPKGAIELEVSDGNFKWDYDLVDNDQLLRGKYSIEQNLLVFATEDGSQMVGTVRMPDRNHFVFRLLGSSQTDPGLEFVRR